MAIPGDMRVVIVGAGQAGGWVAATLRAEGFAGPIALIGSEAYPPYERPPLSKAVLQGTLPIESTYLKPSDFYEKARIDLRTGRSVIAINRHARLLTLDDGSHEPYDKLVLTTGCRARRLTVQGASSDRIHYLRGIDDVVALRRSLHSASRLLIVGGGFIGMEIAASAVKLGIAVTVLEQAPSLMGRVLPSEIGEYMTARHRAQGVQVLTGVKVLGFEDRQAGIAVHLEGGESITADCTVVGIGAIPNSELAAGCGLATDDGIVVDEFGRTEDPDIWAAGDVTSHVNPLLGRRVRLESWQNAQNQAIAVARNLIGEPVPYAEVPWLWTDQYDVNLQMAGLAGSWDEIVLRGAPESGKFTAFGLHGGRAAAAFTINQPREMRTARRMIAARMALDVGSLRDPAVLLQSLLEEKV